MRLDANLERGQVQRFAKLWLVQPLRRARRVDERIAIHDVAPTLFKFFVALALCLPQPSPVVAQEQDQEVRVIELTAKEYEYSLSPIYVKAGTKVQPS
jgi:hypothetical protein